MTASLAYGQYQFTQALIDAIAPGHLAIDVNSSVTLHRKMKELVWTNIDTGKIGQVYGRLFVGPRQPPKIRYVVDERLYDKHFNSNHWHEQANETD